MKIKYGLLLILVLVSSFILISCEEVSVEGPVKYEESLVLDINSEYNNNAVILKINTIELANVTEDQKFDAILIDADIKVLKDNVYWSPENSIMIINDNEHTIPLLLTPLVDPLIKTSDYEHIELVAYVTETDLSKITNIKWTIEEPNFKSGSSFITAGTKLNLTFNVKRDF